LAPTGRTRRITPRWSTPIDLYLPGNGCAAIGRTAKRRMRGCSAVAAGPAQPILIWSRSSGPISPYRSPGLSGDRRRLRNALLRYHRRRERIVPELLERLYRL
jgi:hypothetical protein